MSSKVVYLHRRNDTNEVFYVGIGTPKRPYTVIGRNKHWNGVVNKYGYTIEIIAKNLSWELACKIEIELISLYGRRDLNNGLLVNLTSGGEGAIGKVLSDKTKKLIGSYHKGKIISEKHKEAIRKHTKTLSKEEMLRRTSGLRGEKSKEHVEKIAAKLRKCILDYNTGIYYLGTKEAANASGINQSTLKGWLIDERRNKTTLRYV